MKFSFKIKEQVIRLQELLIYDNQLSNFKNIILCVSRKQKFLYQTFYCTKSNNNIEIFPAKLCTRKKNANSVLAQN